MKIWEIDLNEIGAKYRDQHNVDWFIDNCNDMVNVKGRFVHDIYRLKDLFSLEFEKIEQPVSLSEAVADVLNRECGSYTDEHFRVAYNEITGRIDISIKDKLFFDVGTTGLSLSNNWIKES